MGMIDRRIIQTREYHNPHAEEPKLNYSETFPVTVFEAVRESMNDANSTTLKEVLDELKRSISTKQPILEARSANHLVTYSGVPGGTGAIQISHKIPWDQTQQSHDRIPTEKAVGEVLFTLGLIDEEGKPINDPESKHVRWSDVIGRPNVYIGLGNAEDGFITQKGVTENILGLDEKINSLADEYHGDQRFDQLYTDLENHFTNRNNPHNVTIYQLDGVPMDYFKEHIEAQNPHKLTKADIGLHEVDNTSDMDKPISTATQNALDKLSLNLDGLKVNLSEMEFVKLVTYDQTSGRLRIDFNNGKVEYCHIPIDGLIDEAYYDKDTKDITLVELSGHKTVINLSDLIDYYRGISNNEVNVDIHDFTVGVTLKTNGVDANKLRDLSITTNKLGERSVTSSKIGFEEVKTLNIKDRAVTRTKLFTSDETGVLAVTKSNDDPQYTKVTNDLMGVDAIQTQNILNLNVTTDKLANNSVTHLKIADNAIGTNNIVVKSVTSEKLANSLVLGGNPKLAVRPQANLFNELIPDTRWVYNYVTNEIFENKNLGNRSVDGRVLFSSEVRNRVLTVRGPGTDPQWGRINEEMMADLAVDTRSLIDYSVTTEKLATRSVITNKIENQAVTTNKIADRAVSIDKLAISLHPNMVIGTSEKGEPLYTKILEGMYGPASIRGVDVQNNTLIPAKLQTTDQADMIVGIHSRGTTPSWTKITTGMFNKAVVDGHALFRSPQKNRVIISEDIEEEPFWGQINTEMIRSHAVTREKIQLHAIDHDLLEVQSVDTVNLVPGAVTEEIIHDGAISPSKIKSSLLPDRILAVRQQWDEPVWSKVETDMIKDEAVTMAKLQRSTHAYRVLAATSKDAPPEYTQVTGAMITDHSIGPNELEPNMVLLGEPSLTTHPDIDANDFHLASTRWVNDKIKDRLSKISYEDIENLDWQIYEAVRETLKEFNFSGGGTGGGGTGDNVPTISDDRLQELIDNIMSDVKHQFGASYDPCIDFAPIDDDRLAYLVDQVLGEFEKEIPTSTECDCYTIDDNRLAEIVETSMELAKMYGEFQGVEVVENTCPEWMSLGLEDISYEQCEELLEYGKYVEGRLNRDALIEKKYGNVMACPGRYSTDMDYAHCIELMDTVLKYYHREHGPEMLLEWADLIASEDRSICSIHGHCVLPYFPYTRGLEMINATIYFVDHNKINGYHDWIANNLEIYQMIRGGISGETMVLKKYSVSNEYIASYSVDGRTLFRPSTSNQVLLVDDGGTDPKWGKVESRHIDDGAITHEKIGLYAVDDKNLNVDSVKTHHLQDWSVTAPKIATGSVTPRILADAAVTNEKIATDSVYTHHIIDRAVTSEKIKKRTIISENIALEAITTDLIKDLSVTTDKLENWAVSTDKLANSCVTTVKIADTCITTAKLRDGCVTSEKIQENTIQSKNLANGCVTAVAIADGSIHSFHLSSDFAVTADQIGDNTITGDKIAPNEIESKHIEKDIVLKGKPTVDNTGDLIHKQLRNVIIMNRPPTEDDDEFEDGDIWLYYT